MQHILFSCDPGKATGTAVWDLTKLKEGGDAELLWTKQVDEGPAFFEFVDELFEQYKFDDEYNFEVVCENFIITTQTAKLGAGPWSLKYIGVLEYLCWKYGVKYTLQQPMQKDFAPDERLKALGLNPTDGVQGGHTRDAIRHGVIYLVLKHKWRPEGLLDVD
jgi:hypothetical protein